MDCLLREQQEEATVNYFLKVVDGDRGGQDMITGEFRSLEAIHRVTRDFVPKPYMCGKFDKPPERYFIVTEFRHICEQPPEPDAFTRSLAKLHADSMSPTGKFGFHTTTCHATIKQLTNCWEESWAKLYRDLLEQTMNMYIQKRPWPELKAACDLASVIPKLLDPLQSDGRSIKPCLVHGDLWDENTATDARTGAPFIFDPGSMYGDYGPLPYFIHC